MKTTGDGVMQIEMFTELPVEMLTPDAGREGAPAIVLPLREAEKDCWMQTYTGGVIHPLEPHPDEIRIQDIAGALSKLCRFGGHCAKFYSVAEHCVHLAEVAPDKLKLAALLHDASEAYLVDIPRPLKPWLTGYHSIEDRLMGVIAAKFGFDWPVHPIIKELDTMILSDERIQNMANMDVAPMLWGNTLPPLNKRLYFWDPDRANYEFSVMFHTLYRKGGV